LVAPTSQRSPKSREKLFSGLHDIRNNKSI
jgi:hypothetical protein